MSTHINTKKAKALTSFRAGDNCAQAVLRTFIEDMGVDVDLALGLSSGFGAGMGQLQGTCGAVTGSFMVLSLYNFQNEIDIDKRKENTNDMIQSFHRKFVAIHAATDCKSLLKCDLQSEIGQKFYEHNKLSERLCEKCVQNAIGIVEELLRTKETQSNI